MHILLIAFASRNTTCFLTPLSHMVGGDKRKQINENEVWGKNGRFSISTL